MSHLDKLTVLNLSGNKLGEGVSPEEMQKFREKLACNMPKSVIVLSLEDNPMSVSNKQTSPELVLYRKPFVTELPALDEFDKIPVYQAEKLAHKGVLPKVARDLPGYLDELIGKANLKIASDTLETKIDKEVKLA